MLRFSVFMSAVALTVSPLAASTDKPLKVFILAGQSNMQGKAFADAMAEMMR